MVKIKNLQLLNCITVFSKICSTPCADVKMAYWIGKAANKIDQELAYYETQRKLLLEKFSDKDEKGNIIFEKDASGKESARMAEENKALYIEEHAKLLDVEITLDVPQYTFAQWSNFKLLSAIDMVNLEPFILSDEINKEGN